MQTTDRDEARAIERLIAEIDEIDRWRDRVGRRIVGLFLCTFLLSLGLLAWVVMDARDNPPGPLEHPGPRVRNGPSSPLR
jgi:hypothetical protein